MASTIVGDKQGKIPQKVLDEFGSKISHANKAIEKLTKGNVEAYNNTVNQIKKETAAYKKIEKANEEKLNSLKDEISTLERKKRLGEELTDKEKQSLQELSNEQESLVASMQKARNEHAASLKNLKKEKNDKEKLTKVERKKLEIIAERRKEDQKFRKDGEAHNIKVQAERELLDQELYKGFLPLIDGAQKFRDQIDNMTSPLQGLKDSAFKLKKSWVALTKGKDAAAKLSAADKEKDLEKKGFISEKASKAGGAIKDAATAPIGNMMDMMKGILMGGFMLVALKYLNKFINSDFFKKIIKVIKEKIWPAIKKLWEKAIKPLAEWLLPYIVQGFEMIVDGILMFVDWIFKIVDIFQNEGAEEGFKTLFSDYMSYIWDLTKKVWGWIWEGIKWLFSAYWEYVKWLNGKIWDGIVWVFEWIVDTLHAIFVQPFIDAFNWASKAIDDIVDWFSDIGDLIWDTVVDPIIDMFKFEGKSNFSLSKWIDDVFKDVVKWLGETFGFDTSGIDDFSLSDWIDEKFRDIVKAVGEFFGFDTSAITSDFSIIDWISDTISGLWDTIRGYFGYGPNAIKGDASFMERVGMMIGDFFQSIFYSILESLSQYQAVKYLFGESLKKMMEEVKPAKREAGGPVSAGQLTMVGERGPELMTTGQPGTVHTAQRTQSMLDSALNKKAESQQIASAVPAVNNIITDNSTQSSSGFVSPVEMIINDKLFRAAHSYTC